MIDPPYLNTVTYINPRIPAEQDRLRNAAIVALESVPDGSVEMRLAIAMDTMDTCNETGDVPIDCERLAHDMLTEGLI